MLLESCFIYYLFIFHRLDAEKTLFFILEWETSSPFGWEINHIELWLALLASHKWCWHMANPSSQPYVYINIKMRSEKNMQIKSNAGLKVVSGDFPIFRPPSGKTRWFLTLIFLDSSSTYQYKSFKLYISFLLLFWKFHVFGDFPIFRPP